MSQAQSLLALFILLALATAPAFLYWSRRRDAEDHRSESLSSPLPTPEALARHLYGEAVGWSWKALDDYDHSRLLQAEWKREAELQLRYRLWA